MEYLYSALALLGVTAFGYLYWKLLDFLNTFLSPVKMNIVAFSPLVIAVFIFLAGAFRNGQ